MLNQVESNKAKDLLKEVSSEDLMSLANTITKGQICATSNNEAVRVILSYTADLLSLLRRKKLKREYLFQYLARQGVVVNPDSEKPALIKHIQQYWDKDVANQKNTQTVSEIPKLVHPATSNVSNTLHITNNSTVNQINQTVFNYVSIPVFAPQQPDVTVTGQGTSTASPHQSLRTSSASSEDQELASKFADWYFKMLNACHSENPTPSADEFGPQHFFCDCRLKMACLSSDEMFEDYQTAESVSERLLSFIRQDGILFNPNMDAGGIKGMSDTFGQRVVQVCGTVHRGSTVVGVFEQLFGLVRDPAFDNKFRIKFTNLKMIAKPPNHVPSLDDLRNIFPALNYS